MTKLCATMLYVKEVCVCVCDNFFCDMFFFCVCVCM